MYSINRGDTTSCLILGLPSLWAHTTPILFVEVIQAHTQSMEVIPSPQAQFKPKDKMLCNRGKEESSVSFGIVKKIVYVFRLNEKWNTIC